MKDCYWLLDNDGGLHFDDNYVGPIDLPKTVTSCAGLFAGCSIKNGCYLRHFDLMNVTDFSKMFYKAKLPKGFYLGEHFDMRTAAEKSIDCTSMFAYCEFNNDFDFGDLFVINEQAKVEDMFKGAKIPADFDLGDHFTIYDIKEMFGDREDIGDLYKRFVGVDYSYAKMYYRRDKKGQLAFKAKEYVGPISLPKGITTCKQMFYKCGIAKGCYLEDFDTSEVTCMTEMFKGASLPEGFTFGDKFYTANVAGMHNMFLRCFGLESKNFPKTFVPTAGARLNSIFGVDAAPSCVEDNNGPWYRMNGEWRFNEKYVGPIPLPEPELQSCHRMFYQCDIREGCYLEDFDTSSVEDMSEMFYYCELPQGFTLGDSFNTAAVRDMSAMFEGCFMNDGFSLGDNFVTTNVEDMSYMFNNCRMPEGFTLGQYFDTDKVEDMTCMFANCAMPVGFSLGLHFKTIQCSCMCRMFYKAHLCYGFSLGKNFKVNTHCACRELFRGAHLPKHFICNIQLASILDVNNFAKMFLETKFKSGFELGHNCSALRRYLPQKE